ncbi:hypothetical protein Bca52824_000497 [Brassica carinata]|uniref:Uncharacterized protein n=1 Tax=Brassica carinata TaxID=52824 RepID=A0A8X8BC79_BRACI|nr:hypothetical protein Bca52824_000497 [Brassica carinata]
MPCLYITTNVNMEGVDTDPFYLEVTKAVASIVGRPQNLVMVVLKGSIEIVFGGNKEAAAYAEIVSMGGITKQYIELISLSINPTHFILKVFDMQALPLPSKL